MQTAFFWLAWGIISFWALQTFYYSFSKKKLERLCRAALGINISILILTFVPWVPPHLGGLTGLVLALEGNMPAILFVFCIVGSSVAFLFQNHLILKLAALATIANTFILFMIMYQLRPGTFILSWYDIAPIVAMVLLLINDVVVLLLWQQLQLKKKR